MLTARFVDRHAPNALLRSSQRDLDLEDAVLVRGLRLLGRDVRPELDEPPERSMLNLDLLVEAPAGLGGAALTGDQELAPADLERHVGDVDPGEVRLDHRPGRVVGVEHVDRRGEAAPAQPGLALEDVTEEHVDLAPHTLEVREQIALLAHAARG